MRPKYGLITHVVHYIYDGDLEDMEQELMEEDSDNGNDNGHVIVTPKFYVSHLYESMSNNIRSIPESFQRFSASFQHRLYVKKEQ